MSSLEAPLFDDPNFLSPPPYHPSRVVVIAVKQSPKSQALISWAAINVLKEDDEVVLLNVRKGPREIMSGAISGFGSPVGIDTETLIRLDVLEQRSSHQLLKDLGAYLVRTTPICNIRCISLQGAPRTHLVNKVNSLHADILILATTAKSSRVPQVLHRSLGGYCVKMCPKVKVVRAAVDATQKVAYTNLSKVELVKKEQEQTIRKDMTPGSDGVWWKVWRRNTHLGRISPEAGVEEMAEVRA